MVQIKQQQIEIQYAKLLKDYLLYPEQFDEHALEELSKEFIEQNIFPDDIMQMHMKVIEQAESNEVKLYKRSLAFLSTVFSVHRFVAEKYDEEQTEQLELQSEIQVAAKVQRDLLATEVPHITGVDIGALSIPFYEMNGDYLHFVKNNQGGIGVAIADVIGKGIPAALSMSMIKFAMDGFYEETLNPQAILRNLNAVVERNVSQNMFITMLCGNYFPEEHRFIYASAGHEPGFIYRAKEDRFIDLEAEGIVLGVLKNTVYNQYSIAMEKGDMIVLLTDGVTECKIGDRFINRDEVIEVIRKYINHSAQEQVEFVYNHFQQLSDYELRDDFSLVIIKREENNV